MASFLAGSVLNVNRVDVIAVVGDVGQEHEGLEKIKQKALKSGALDCLVVDMRETFAKEYLAKALAANAMYENKYPLVSALSRPLISKHYGAGDADGGRRVRNTNYLITISLGVLGWAAMYLLRNQVPLLFGASDETAGLIAYALPVFSTASVFYGFTPASTSYFYAVDDAKAPSALVSGAAPLVVPILFGAARLFGLDGIWLSVTAVQMVLSVAAAALLRYRHRARRPDRAAEPAARQAR